MKVIIHAKEEKTVFYEKNILAERALLDSGVEFSMPCGGNHTCGKCRIKIIGEISEIGEAEKKLLGDAPPNVRLACFAEIRGDSEIFLDSLSASVMIDGFKSDFKFDPIANNYGIAVDIGTTTVVVYLYNLNNGVFIDKEAFANPQSVFGGDVISRIEASLNGKSEMLKNAITEGIGNAVNALCLRADILPHKIEMAVITGNTTMLYMLLGKDVACLSAAPFQINDYLGKVVDDIKVADNISIPVYLPSTISSFVGSDITCALLSSMDIMEAENSSLLIDIGTNGEMAILQEGKIFCCSTAAGPAFEGAGIQMGCMAADGAVNQVWLENDKILYTSIGDQKPIGICGSGIIDAISVMVSCGLIDESGCIDESNAKFSQYITQSGGQTAVRVGDSGVIITQKDIRAVQLAKAAIRAGVESLLNACHITADEIGRLVLAGGFGSYINVKSAGKIGLIPQALTEKAIAVGNAAGMGAVSILLSKEALNKSKEIAQKAKTLDLATSEFFMNSYVENMMFI